jgi:hypothetical protein
MLAPSAWTSRLLEFLDRLRERAHDDLGQVGPVRDVDQF